MRNTTITRDCLTSDRNYYVSHVGNGAGDGSLAHPWETRAQAWAWCRDNLDLCGHKIVVTLLTGSSETGTLFGPLTGQVMAEDFLWQGGGGPLNCVLQAPAGAGLFGCNEEARFAIDGVTLQGGLGIVIAAGTVTAGNVWFKGNSIGVDACGPRARFVGIGRLTFLMSAFQAGFVAEDHAQIELGCELAISGAPNFSGAFVQSDLGGLIDATNATVMPGAATGRRYQAYTTGIVFTGTGQARPDFFPGDQPGQANQAVEVALPRWFWQRPQSVAVPAFGAGTYL